MSGRCFRVAVFRTAGFRATGFRAAVLRTALFRTTGGGDRQHRARLVLAIGRLRAGCMGSRSTRRRSYGKPTKSTAYYSLKIRCVVRNGLSTPPPHGQNLPHRHSPIAPLIEGFYDRSPNPVRRVIHSPIAHQIVRCEAVHIKPVAVEQCHGIQNGGIAGWMSHKVSVGFVQSSKVAEKSAKARILACLHHIPRNNMTHLSCNSRQCYGLVVCLI